MTKSSPREETFTRNLWMWSSKFWKPQDGHSDSLVITIALWCPVQSRPEFRPLHSCTPCWYLQCWCHLKIHFRLFFWLLLSKTTICALHHLHETFRWQHSFRMFIFIIPPGSCYLEHKKRTVSDSQFDKFTGQKQILSRFRCFSFIAHFSILLSSPFHLRVQPDKQITDLLRRFSSLPLRS